MKCDDEKGGSSTSEMDMDSVGGVFLTLIVGCAVGVIIVVCEFCWKRAKLPYGQRVSALYGQVAPLSQVSENPIAFLYCSALMIIKTKMETLLQYDPHYLPDIISEVII